ncbi:MAG: hypothetical protein K2N56_07060 [Oscillospiraceae bacterium]|nr:hypothetical protein [Oscillospiraceae bacterium]
MKFLLLIIPTVSVIFAFFNGNMPQVSQAILDKSGEAVQLAISICGIMCFWCGMMKVAERAGLVEKISALLSPIVGLLFRNIKKGGKAAGLITMNLAANILGLGNASTPLGIAAMRAVSEENGSEESGTATEDMIMLAVLNTASLQIIPTTAAALRSANGCAAPLDILPCVWIVSVYSVTIAVISAKIMGAVSRKRGKTR